MRYNDYRFHLAVMLRMGTLTAFDMQAPSKRQQLSSLDPAAIGKAMWDAAGPHIPFVNMPRMEVSYPGQHMAEAMGATSEGNMERTSAQVTAMSDGYETRFLGTSPTANFFDPASDIAFHPMLSTRPPFYSPDDPPNPAHTLLIAPWPDPEMLGQAVLNIFAMAGPPVNKGMTSVFCPPDPKRRGALHRAAREGLLHALPQRKPRNPSPVDTVGTTPLMLAAGAGHTDIAEHLLAWGADVELRDSQGQTALHHAAKGGHEETIETLLKFGADPTLADLNGSTPLHLSASRGFVEASSRLLSGEAPPNARDRLYSSTPLHLTARAGHQDLLPVLVSAGCDPNAVNEAGRTPLHVAAAYGHPAMVQELIDAGSEVNYRDSRGETPLHRPAFYQHLECIRCLLRAGASPGAPDHHGDTPLHVAARMNRVKTVQLLLESGADSDATNAEGMTPLDLAIVNVHKVCSRPARLLKEGTIGVGSEHNSETVEILLGYGASIEPLRIPVGERHALWPHLTPADLLLPSGDINYAKLPGLSDAIKRQLPDEDKYGNAPLNDFMNSATLLHDAVTKGMPHLIEILVKAGAFPDTAIRNYMNPLHTAAGQGNREMVDLLLKLGADLEAPISNARDGRYDPWVQMWNRKHPGQEFDERWLRIAIRMNTALDFAVLCKQVVMVRYLLDLGAVPMPYLIGRPPCFDSQMEALAHHQEGYNSYRWTLVGESENQAMAEMFREFVDIPYPHPSPW